MRVLTCRLKAGATRSRVLSRCRRGRLPSLPSMPSWLWVWCSWRIRGAMSPHLRQQGALWLDCCAQPVPSADEHATQVHVQQWHDRWSRQSSTKQAKRHPMCTQSSQLGRLPHLAMRFIWPTLRFSSSSSFWQHTQSSCELRAQQNPSWEDKCSKGESHCSSRLAARIAVTGD